MDCIVVGKRAKTLADSLVARSTLRLTLNNEDDMEQAKTMNKKELESANSEERTIHYHPNGIEISLGDGRKIRALETADNEPDGMYFEFVGRPKHGDPNEISFYQEADDGTPFITLGMTREACMTLFLMLAELEDRGFFGIDDFGDQLPNTIDNRNDKNGTGQ